VAAPLQRLAGLWNAPLARCVRMAAAVGGWRGPAIVALLIVGCALPALEMLALGALVGSLPATVNGGLGAAAGQRTLGALAVWAALMMLLQIAPRLRTATATTLGWRLDASLRERAMRALSRPWGIAHLEDPAVADLISRISGIGVAGYTPGGAVGQLISVRVATVLSALASGALLVGYHWWAPALLFAVLAMHSVIRGRSYVRRANSLAGRTPAARRAEYFRDLALAPAAAKEVRLLGVADWLTGRLRDAWRTTLDEQDRSRARAFQSTLAASLVVIAANALVYGLLAMTRRSA
jgi:ATP-binding cassette subfamily B protein